MSAISAPPEAGAATAVTLSNIHKRYASLAVVHGVDLEILPGTFTVFVGPSGCGKSTLLRMIAGLEEISEGTLLLDGEEMNSVPAAKRGIAMVFQSYALYPHMSVYQNLAFGLETARLPKPEIVERVHRAAQILQIEPLLKRKPKQLSGGQRQRVAIGRAIVREPRIFLFDEPLSNLDAELRVQMRVEIAKLHKSLGSTMIYVTHDQVEAMTMADKIVVLNAGRIEQSGSPLELYNRPCNKFVAGFIGSPKMNMLEGRVESVGDAQAIVRAGGVALTLQRIAAAHPGDAVTVGIRPEHLKARPADGLVPFAEADVSLVENLGSQTQFYAAMPDGQPLTVLMEGQGGATAAGRVSLFIDPGQVHLFAADGRAI